MTNATPTTLLISSRRTEDNQLIWRAAIQRGWTVERVQGIRVPDTTGSRIVLYIESLFAPTLARQLGLELVQVPESWLPSLPEEYRRREVHLTTLGDVARMPCPCFVKPPNEKSFPAQVYNEAESLALAHDYGPETVVLVASPIKWDVEFRCFCLDGRVRTLSPYLRHGQLSRLEGFASTQEELQDAIGFAERLMRDACVDVPRAIVLDVGIITSQGWAVVEANVAWGSGIYGCDPDEALDVIEHATVNRNDTSP
jgi:hypothetical protein